MIQKIISIFFEKKHIIRNIFINFAAEKNLRPMITKLKFEPGRLGNYMELVPYNTTVERLYTAETLYSGYDMNDSKTFAESYDQRVYNYYIETGKRTENPLEMLCRGLHDLGITRALNEFLECYPKKKVVAVMGGNAMKRCDAAYRKIVEISKSLTEQGTLMVSGGGSGAMEATSLGGLLAGYDNSVIDDALEMLCVAPCYHNKGYMKAAFDVLERFPHLDGYETLTIPTWFYGHEPSNPFATHIAKYFDNSIREDTLLTISFGGIIFTPGSAGTMQEIFQEAVQNHYLTYDMASPMVFLDSKYWTETIPVYPFLQRLSTDGRYKNLMLSLTDSPDEVVNRITEFQNS